MSPGKKPEMRLPPNRPTAEDRLRDLERAGEWAKAPAVADAANAGLEPPESLQVGLEEGGEGEDVTVELGTPLKSLRQKREKKKVNAMLELSAELNARLENLLDHIPRSSKRRLLMTAVEEYVTKVERAIEKRKATG